MTTRRYRIWLYALSTGAVTLGWLQGWAMINWGTLWTNLIAQWLDTLVLLLFGITPTTTT